MQPQPTFTPEFLNALARAFGLPGFTGDPEKFSVAPENIAAFRVLRCLDGFLLTDAIHALDMASKMVTAASELAPFFVPMSRVVSRGEKPDNRSPSDAAEASQVSTTSTSLPDTSQTSDTSASSSPFPLGDGAPIGSLPDSVKKFLAIPLEKGHFISMEDHDVVPVYIMVPKKQLPKNIMEAIVTGEVTELETLNPAK